jgi:hypothetical protein
MGVNVEPSYTLPYSEFCVAQQLARAFPASRGFSIYAPLSRQEHGVDLILARRARGQTRAATIQVKASRTYSRPTLTARTKRPFRYHTWFNTFACPEQADFFCLIALYPALDARERHDLGTWWAPLILVFTQTEMRRFLKRVRTVRGRPDRMFGFGFNEASSVYQVRGDQRRRFTDYSKHLLKQRASVLRKFFMR